jgi:hypothetical protein
VFEPVKSARHDAVKERLRAATTLRIVVRASVGSSATKVANISRSRRDAGLVILLLANGPSSTSVASARQVRSRLTLLELAQVFRDTPRFQSEHAKSILALDARFIRTPCATGCVG